MDECLRSSRQAARGLRSPISLVGALLVALATLTACAGNSDGVDEGDSAVESVDPMPALVGQRLDVALSDLAAIGVGEDDVELVGGGAFGVLDESNWDVCEQRPEPGSTDIVDVRLIVDRQCPESTNERMEEDADTTLESEASDVESVESADEGEPESPAVFITAARRDLRDIRKDLNDLETAFREGGLLRVAGNQVELAFNLGQLGARIPPEEFTQTWTERLDALDLAIEDIGLQLDGDGSPGTVLDAIDSGRSAVKAGLSELKEFEKSLDG